LLQAEELLWLLSDSVAAVSLVNIDSRGWCEIFQLNEKEETLKREQKEEEMESEDKKEGENEENKNIKKKMGFVSKLEEKLKNLKKGNSKKNSLENKIEMKQPIKKIHDNSSIEKNAEKEDGKLSYNKPELISKALNNAIIIAKLFMQIITPELLMKAFHPQTPTYELLDLFILYLRNEKTKYSTVETQTELTKPFETKMAVERCIFQSRYKQTNEEKCNYCQEKLRDKIVCIFPNGSVIHLSCADIINKKINNNKSKLTLDPASYVDFSKLNCVGKLALKNCILEEQQKQSLTRTFLRNNDEDLSIVFIDEFEKK
jgi:hypothetical protein